MRLYHGSTVAVRKPSIRAGRPNADFGKGFYTTSNPEQFVSDNSADIKAALSQEPLPFLYRQPIVIFAFYTIRKRQNYLMTNWPYTHDSLKQVAMSMNISGDAIV